MYLKSLEMQGFKSFPDKTKLVFDTKDSNPGTAGVTVIVGPNGSGKSNISDAMRWVLGEISSKSLRGTKMEDVIFGGADSRKPMSYAEVSVTFDNTDPDNKLDCPFEEVTVTRRYYRAGESEYYINRRAVRLKDIYELFMNTGIGRDGYSIIGQGRIAEMVSRKSEDRRSIFEDASGIAKYRHRKTEAEHKLEQVEDNMTRIRDIFSVIESQVGPLEKESARAKKAIELMDNKKRADVSLWLYDTERLRRDLDKAEENLRHSTFDLERIGDAVSSTEEQYNRLFDKSQTNKQESEELLTKIRTQTDENHRLESDTRVRENNIGHVKDLIAAGEGSRTSIQRSVEAEMEACKTHTGRIAVLEEDKRTAEKEREALTEESSVNEKKLQTLTDAIATAGADATRLEAEAVDVHVRLSVVENARRTDDGKNDSMRSELEGYAAQSDTFRTQCDKIQKTISGYDERLTALDAESREKEEKRAELSAQVAENTAHRNEKLLRRDTLRQRINTYRTMEEQFEGYNNSVRFVMNQYKEGRITAADGALCGRIYGPLSKLISVEDRYVTAIEMALGANLQNIVVEDERTAKAAMFALKRSEAGRATFFPLSSMKASQPTREMSEAAGFTGYVGVADELLTADAAFRGVLSSLLGKTLIFDTIDNANRMARALGFRVRVVTLDGQQINVGGSFTGGSVRQKGGLLSRAGEIKRMEEELTETEEALRKLEEVLGREQSEIGALKEELTRLEDDKGIIAVLRSGEAGRLEQANARLDANETLLAKVKNEYEQILHAREQYEQELEELKSGEADLRARVAEIQTARQDMDSERADIEERQRVIGEKLTGLFVRVSGICKDIETEQMLTAGCEERIAALTEQLNVIAGQQAEYADRIREDERILNENRRLLEEGQSRAEGLNARRKLVEDDAMSFEKRLNELNRTLREKMEEKEVVLRAHTKNEAHLANLRAEQDKLSTRLWDEYEMTRNDAVALGYPPVTADNRLTMLAMQTECRNKLRVLGNVDLDAVEKYKEVKTKYDEMSRQIGDLDASRAELTKIIDGLEKEMKASFVTCFNQINENFGKVFSELFGGGSAELSLTDPDNVLESGIEIKAAPPGKIIKSLMQLSGGEQSFIGVALFFAILQVNPTPFCILDEIEAALDEVNVERLAQYIKRYSDGTQFIMITHRRGTMAAATTLYGVTMPEHGISKVLTLDIANISKEKGDNWDGIFG